MKALITGVVCASVFAAAPASAQEPQWRASGSSERVQAQPTSAITLSRPVPIAAGTVEPVSFTTAPVAAAPVAAAPASAAPVSSAATLARPVPLFRGKAPDLDDSHQLMPIGPASAERTPGIAKPMSAVRTSPAAKTTYPVSAPRIIREPAATATASTPETPYLDQCTPVTGDDCIVDCGPCPEECGPWWNRWGHRLLNCFENCFDGCCIDECCLPRSCRWVRAEYLLWHTSSQGIPTLLTREDAPIRPIDGGAGTLPVATRLLGDDTGDEVRSGVRAQFGFWFPRRPNLGLDLGGFLLIRRANNLDISSDSLGNPVLARPFFDVTLPGENAQIISFPGEFAGRFAFDSTTQVWGADINLRRKLHCGPRYWVDGFLGYRHLQLHDTIDITEQIMDINPAPGDVLAFGVRDRFETRNQFNGVNIGFEGEVRILRRMFVAGGIKVALGNVHQVLNIDGSTVFLLPGGGASVGRGGLLALNSNIGRHEHDEFAVVPEFGIKLGFDLTDNLRVYAGYNVLCLSSALRAGEQIDRRINPNMLPDIAVPPGLNPPVVQPARPAVLLRDSSFWAGGAQFGLEYHW